MNLFAFISYVVTTTFTPGPNNLMAMSNGLHTGFRRTIKFLGGVLCGFFLVMLICGLVNFALMTLIPSLRLWLNLLGAGYMLYLAFHVITSEPHAEELDQNLNSFKAGLSMQFINPKVILYGITVFSNFIIPSYRSAAAIMFFAVFLATVGLLASSAWASFGVVFRTFLQSTTA
ncbi:MAG TPA: LysE family transporter [Anaerolineales bacterium]|jgi:threonine/homoserine/homoserine lactone efflux protein|nr:LysE family transporter [Anaerolineales bacterium]